MEGYKVAVSYYKMFNCGSRNYTTQFQLPAS